MTLAEDITDRFRLVISADSVAGKLPRPAPDTPPKLTGLNAAIVGAMPRATTEGCEDPARVQSALDVIGSPPKPRNQWMRIVWAIRHGLGDAGEPMARAWSKLDSGVYTDEGFDNVWKSYRSRPDGITVATLYAAALAVGWKYSPDVLTWEATESSEPRYKLLGGADLRNLPLPASRVHGVLPAAGIASYFGPSASGKSFLVFDTVAAIAEGRAWFGHKVVRCPVVYVVLEGSAGIRARVRAWEKHHDRPLPDDLHFVLQQFDLTVPQDVEDMISAVLGADSGAVIVIDTLNASAPGIDENSSRDMGTVLEAAKVLQARTGGLVVLVHHTGKDPAKGLRGHSSLFAALDAAIEVVRDGDSRSWRVAKAKDGKDGGSHPFRLEVVQLGVDDDGQPATSCVVVPETAAKSIQRVKLPQGGNQRLVLDALRPLFDGGETGIVGSPATSRCISLEVAVTTAASRLTCAPARRAERTRTAITGLVARGVIGCNEGWLWLAR